MRYTSVLTHHRWGFPQLMGGCRQGLFGFGNPSLGQKPGTFCNGLGHVGYRFENSLYLWGDGHGNLRVGGSGWSSEALESLLGPLNWLPYSTHWVNMHKMGIQEMVDFKR